MRKQRPNIEDNHAFDNDTHYPTKQSIMSFTFFGYIKFNLMAVQILVVDEVFKVFPDASLVLFLFLFSSSLSLAPKR